MVRTKPLLYDYQVHMGMLGGPQERSIEDLGMRSILDTKANTSCVSLVGAPGYQFCTDTLWLL